MDAKEVGKYLEGRGFKHQAALDARAGHFWDEEFDDFEDRAWLLQSGQRREVTLHFRTLDARLGAWAQLMYASREHPPADPASKECKRAIADALMSTIDRALSKRIFAMAGINRDAWKKIDMQAYYREFGSSWVLG